MKLGDLVGDWGGFERLVARLYETGDVTVEHDVTLPGRSGAPRQIDVLIRHRQGFHEHLVIVECKYLKSAVERFHVDALAVTLREVGASKGVIFSSSSFQDGAVRQARHENIDLFMVRDLSRTEWGNSGRIVDLFLQMAQVGISNLKMQGAYHLSRPVLRPDPDDAHLDISIGHPDPAADSATQLLEPDGAPGARTLEEHIVQAVQARARDVLYRSYIFNSGEDGTYYLGCPLTIKPQPPFRIARKNGLVQIDALEVPAALKIRQSRISIDRAEQLEFALAVESKITGEILLASRGLNAGLTILRRASGGEQADGDLIQNGQMLSMLLDGYFDMKEMAGRTAVPVTEATPFRYVDPNDG